MKVKRIFLIFMFFYLTNISLILSGCNNKNTYKLTKIIYDTESNDPITFNIEDNECKALFGEKIKEVGNKIILRKIKLIFNGEKTKNYDGSFWYARDDKIYIGFNDSMLMASYAGF